LCVGLRAMPDALPSTTCALPCLLPRSFASRSGAVPLCRHSGPPPWPSRPARARALTRTQPHTHTHACPCTHARAHVRLAGQRPAFGRPQPNFVGVPSAAHQGVATGGTFPPRNGECQDAIESARALMRTHAQILAGNGHPSLAVTDHVSSATGLCTPACTTAGQSPIFPDHALALMHTPAHAHSRAHTGVERPRLAFGRSKPDHTGILSAADQAHATGDLCYRPTALGPNPDPETTCARPSARAHPRTRVLRPRQLRHPSRYHAPLLRVCRVEPPLVAVIRHPYPSPLLSFP
jgi:hypothetical protein